MSIAQSLLPEFDAEMTATRTVLERVPEDKLEWRPHEKSMPLGHLAHHIARLPQWGSMTFKRTEIDLASPEAKDWRPDPPKTRAEILRFFDTNMAEARQALMSASDADFDVPWTLRMGDQKFFTIPRSAVYRKMVMSHSIHHRAQLTVYFRLVGVPVPPLYGPTADEAM
jgi:uncharacterized damage-inducible protein DinB